MFQNNVREFLEVSQLSKTNFCRGVGISATMLNCWLRGERNISMNLENRIREYMQNYVKRLVEISV